MSDSEPDHPGVIAPPPLLFLGTLLLGTFIDHRVWRLSTGLGPEWRHTLTVLLGTAALALLVGALGGFQRAGTRAEPWKPSTAVVTTGVYRITRNPMYLAMALLYAAASLVLDSGISLCLLAPLLVLVRKGVIEREERYLEHKFGEDYRAYKRTVRRWI